MAKKPTYEELEEKVRELEENSSRDGQSKNESEMGFMFEDIINASVDAMVIADEDLKVLLWNPSAEKIFGYKEKEMIGRRFPDLIIPEKNRERAVKKFGMAVRTGTLSHMGKIVPTEGLRKDGSRFPLEHTISMFETNGEARFVAILRDMSGQEAVKRALQRSAGLTENIIDTVRDPLLVLDADLRVVSATHSFCQTFKVSQEETKGQLLYDLGNRQWDIPKLRDLLEEILPENTVFNDYEIEHEFEHIGKRIMLLNARQTYTEASRTQQILLAIEDVTEQILAKRVANKAKEYAESIVATIREPLVILDSVLRVKSANRSFYQIFETEPEKTVGNLLYDIGEGQWNIPELRRLLEEILPQQKELIDFEVEHEFPAIGRKNMLLNARMIIAEEEEVILLAIEDVTERVEATQKVERAVFELTQLIDTANAPIFGVDTDGNINEWNQMVARITGYAKDEVEGKNLVKEHITDEYKGSVKEVLDKALKGEETDNYEVPLFTKDGDRIMVLLNASTRRDADGNIVGVVGVGQDITEIDAYRAEMERTSTELTQLIDTANAPIFGVDTDGNINEWNQMVARITGYGKDEVEGKNLVKEYITDEYKTSVKEVLDKALKGEETDNYEVPLFTKGGDRIMVLLNASTRRDADGNIVGVVGVGQDITEIDAIRGEMERTSIELTQLIDTANAPIFGVDTDGNINEWNQMVARITGYGKDEVEGKNLVKEYITNEYKAPVKEVLDKALKGEETDNYEVPLFTKGGDRIMVLLNATTRRDADGNIVGVVGVGQDITEIDAMRVRDGAYLN